MTTDDTDLIPELDERDEHDSGYGLNDYAPELIDHPAHYNSHPSGVECIDIIRHMPYSLGAVYKHLWRAGLKDGNPTLQDLKKAQWYLDDYIIQMEIAEESKVDTDSGGTVA